MPKLPKKDTKFTINKLFDCPVNSIRKEINAYSSEWDIDTSRQDENVVHSNTKMFQLIYSNYKWLHGSELECTVVNELKSDQAKDELKQIFDAVEDYYGGKVIRAEIIKMMPMTKIPRHVDGGQMLTYSRRCHLPINTHEDIFFTVMDNKVNMRAGTLYEINNILPHSVENNSTIERDHLILDIMPLEML